MAPHGELASSKYCLANPGVEYLIYRPASSVNLTVKLPARTFAVTWFDIANGREVPAEPVRNVGSQYGFTSIDHGGRQESQKPPPEGPAEVGTGRASYFALKSKFHQPSSHFSVTFRHPNGTCG
jgi:hypothetical protein